MKAQEILRNGETIEIEGCLFRMLGDGRPSRAGEWYIAERNGGPKLLTVKEFAFYHPRKDLVRLKELKAKDWPSWIYSVEFAYPYDYNECCLVEEVF
jgi:hypothetical protein